MSERAHVGRGLTCAAAAVLLVVASLCLAPAARADDVPPGHRTVVTPDRGEARIFDTARAVFVTDAARMDALVAEDVSEALGELPGVSVQRTNRGASSPLLRGLVGPQNLLLVDGVRFNTAIFRTGPNQYPALIAPGVLGAVEVVLGPASVLYGSDAMGGTIGYRTLDVPTRAGWSGQVDAVGASADLGAELAARLGFASDVVAGWARVGARLHQDLRAGGGEVVPLSGYDQVDWATRWVARPGDRTRITATLLGTSLTDAGRTDALPRGDVRVHDNLDNFGYVRLEHRFVGSALHKLELTAHARHLEDVTTRWRCPTTTDGAVVDRAGCVAAAEGVAERRTVHVDDVTVLGFQASLDARGFEGRLAGRIGADLHHEWIGSRRDDDPTARGTFSDGSTYAGFGVYGSVEGRPLVVPDVVEVVVTGALRGVGAFASASDVPGLGQVDYDYYGLVAGGSARALLGNRLNLHVGVSQGFRAPNLQETTALGDTGQTFEVPNAELGPERSTVVEAGARVETPELSVSVNLFHNAMSDAIVRESATYQGEATVSGKEVVRRVNATEATYRGGEIALVARPVESVAVSAAWSFIDGEQVARDGTRTPPRRLPPHMGRVAFTWQATPSFRVGADVRLAAGQTELNPEDARDVRICGDPNAPHTLLEDCEGTPGWVSVGADALWQVDPAWSLRLRVDNALDASYRVHGSGYPAAGINARLGARYAF